MSWLSSFMHPGKGYEKGQEQLDKYYQQGQDFLQPYNQNGQDQGFNLNEFIQNLMNPEALQNKWSQGYQESDAAKQAEGMATEHGLNAASSMGLMGSSPALQAIQGGTTKIGLDERQNYMDNLMQKYLAGAGLSQGLYNTGANSANSLSQNATNMGQNSANMAYGQESAGGNMLSNILGRLFPVAGGFALGGKEGALSGLGLGNKWNTKGGK